jgi:uncharacterized protein
MTIPRNRLADATSPYLLQHAANPVDWHPWSEEAFERARREDKPVFLSIGYSTCHWCHVMARESFEDPAVADLLNRYFVSIKVDKEERPDLDALYMAVVQQMTGRGGWPLTVILTPDQKPFFSGTFLPKTSRWGRPGMLQLLPAIHEAWKSHRSRILETADEITSDMAEAARLPAPGLPLGEETLARAEADLIARYDRDHGGFGSAPKFPTPHQLSFLLRRYHRHGNPFLLEMVETTLVAMRRGGIFDHVGLGFHRYATDVGWQVPHFEKMLYDQALVSMAYLEAWQVTGRELFRQTAKDILSYVLSTLRSPEGGFYTAEDADSEGVEGAFYRWTAPQIESVLGPEDAPVFMAAYGIAGRTAASQGPGEFHILHLSRSLGEIAREIHLSEEVLTGRLEDCRRKLLKARGERNRPFKDDKILTDWNGLIVAALARAGRVLDDSHYSLAARTAADFILETLRDDNGHLLKSYREGKARGAGLLEDYAYLVWGLIELYESLFDPALLETAVDLSERMLKRFQDPLTGSLFTTPRDGEKPLFEHHGIQDSAIPSGNAVAAMNLLRLRDLTGRMHHGEAAERIMTAFSALVSRSPWQHTHLMMALDLALNPGVQIVVVGTSDTEETKRMLAALEKPFLPEKAVIFKPAGDDTGIRRLVPRVASMTAMHHSPTAYICREFTCERPTWDVGEMLKRLGKKSLQRLSF